MSNEGISRHSRGKLSNRLHLSAERKKNRGAHLKAWRERKKENAPKDVAIQCDLSSFSFESRKQMVQLKQEVSILQEILPNPDISSSSGTNLDSSQKQTSFTPMSYLPYSEPFCEENVNQEPNQDSFSTSEHSLPSIRHSFSLNSCRTSESNFTTCPDLSQKHSSSTSSNHLPSSQAIEIKQEPDQDSYSSSENPLPSIKNFFSLNPIETTDSAICFISTDNKNSFETKYDLLGKNWAEKMKSLSNDQRIYAEKLINDVFFLAEVGHLRHVCHDGKLWFKIEK